MEESFPGQIHLPERKNFRATFHDYCGGVYFVTICTYAKSHFFGQVVEDKMVLNNLGIIADDIPKTICSHYPYADIPLWVVMPNHVHLIIAIDGNKFEEKRRSALSIVVGGYKQSVTTYARLNNIDFDWQKRYHEHIIRSTDEMNKIARYIENNPAVWGADCYNQK